MEILTLFLALVAGSLFFLALGTSPAHVDEGPDGDRGPLHLRGR